MFNRRTFGFLFAAGLIAFVAIQFLRPTISYPPVTADLQVPPEVKQILRTSCYDCHSNETKLAWFDQIVPAYWVVARDVNVARHHVNFSDIGSQPPAQQAATLYEAVNQIQLGAMPLPAYTRLHSGTSITPEQLNILKGYLLTRSTPLSANPSDMAADDAQYQSWISGAAAPHTVAPAPNGIAFVPEYKDWQVVSTTDRFDNGSMRAILGNGAAIKAIAANQTNPWPDGTSFAKIAWLGRGDGPGKEKPGAFWQVEFMIRDSRKYAATKGWGWARWRSANLTPYGKDAGFTEECIGCHTPVRDRDYVYTPINRSAAIEGTLPWNPLQWKVITSSIDKQGATMSTLFGNDVAIRRARAGSRDAYPAGSVLALVTWTQQEDAHWFGGKIPRQVKSVEFVSVAVGSGNQPVYSYQAYEGSPLVRKPDAEDRSAYLIGLRAAVLP